MKFAPKSLFVLAFAGATLAATASAAPFPSSADEQTPLSQEFPYVDTYKRDHRDSLAQQAPVAYPAAAQQEYPLSDELPGTQSFQSTHTTDQVARSATPAFPYSVPDEESLADEGLVPGIEGTAPYASTVHAMH